MTKRHNRKGNCLDRNTVFRCKTCGPMSSTSACDVCHEHEEVRGDCSGCPPCLPCMERYGLTTPGGAHANAPKIQEQNVRPMTPTEGRSKTERLVFAGAYRIDVDDDGVPFWRGGGADDKNESEMNPNEPLRLDPNHFPPGTVVTAMEPEDSHAFYDALVARQRQIHTRKTEP